MGAAQQQRPLATRAAPTTDLGFPSIAKESTHEWLLERTESAALGRPSLLSSQQGQPVASLRERNELPLPLRDAVLRSRDGPTDRLADRHDDPPGGPPLLRAARLRPGQPG